MTMRSLFEKGFSEEESFDIICVNFQHANVAFVGCSVLQWYFHSAIAFLVLCSVPVGKKGSDDGYRGLRQLC